MSIAILADRREVAVPEIALGERGGGLREFVEVTRHHRGRADPETAKVF